MKEGGRGGREIEGEREGERYRRMKEGGGEREKGGGGKRERGREEGWLH